jgi:predicted transcriptional regulator/ribosomal protein S18 acetylase RimI-like enzyme
MDDEYSDRIFSQKEIKDLKELLLYQKLGYPNYENWVEDTIKDVIDSKKKAFGLFEKELVGDGVIRITASDTVELKNFYIHPDFRGKGNGPKLLKCIEDYCSEHSYSQIQVDAYIDETSTVGFFIKHGFEFQARGDFYGTGNESYLLVKKLPPKFIGGYDWIDISKWTTEKLWDFKLIKEINKNCYLYKRSEDNLDINCSVLIIDNLDKEIDKKTLQSFYELDDRFGMSYCFAPFFSEESKIFAKEKGIELIDHDKLERLTGLDLPKSYDEIAGFIVAIKPEFFNELLEKEDRVFIRGGTIPNGVEKGQVLLFYVAAPISGVKGHSIIQHLICDDPDDLWEKHSIQSAFSDDEYKTYTGGKNCVTAFSFDKIEEIAAPIGINKVREILNGFNHQTGQKITVKEWKKLYEML